LIIESIRIYGHDIYYIPRVLTDYDSLLTEDDASQYNNAYMIEMYIKSVDGFTGDGNFMSKFGVEIRDQVIFSVSQRVFNQEIGVQTTQPRPNEGDLIFFPLNQKCFQIKYVNKFEMFYQFGALQTWELTCELFEYSNEQFNTGIPAIDILQTNFSTSIMDWSLLDENNWHLMDEDNNIFVVDQYDIDTIDTAAMNDIFASNANTFLDFTETNPFSEFE